MYGLPNDYLCTAKRIICVFLDKNKKRKEISGTCFFVKNNNDKLCLITNRHIVDINYKEETSKFKDFELFKIFIQCKSKNAQTGLPTEDTELLILNHLELKLPTNQDNDIACLIEPQVFNQTNPLLQTFIDFWIPYELIATQEKLNNNLTICDFVAFPGFPEWYDKKNRLPIIRTGTIASDSRLDYSEKEEDQGNRIAYEAFSHGGSSGSPVFALAKGINVSGALSGGGYRPEMLIGINGGHYTVSGSPSKEHSGLSYFYKSSSIIELIDN
ncbi:MAG: trypsin-like peptidase domain-containing protein [Flavobacteriales bacterium]|nr:trypsin-like peptidase domain-containing protein [Flavobacteriales bacterium]